MKNIYIVGGDGFARECYMYLQWMKDIVSDIEFAGFLGHGGYGDSVDYKNFQYLYKGEVSQHNFSDDEYAVIGAGYPKLRKKIYDELKAREIKFYNILSPNVYINPYVEVGEANVFVAPFCPAPNIKIGNGNVFNGDVVVGHDVQIGDFNFFGPKSQLLGNVKVGNMNEIAANSILLPKSKIGNNNKIAPMSCIYKGFKDNCYISGNPALKIGEVENAEV